MSLSCCFQVLPELFRVACSACSAASSPGGAARRRVSVSVLQLLPLLRCLVCYLWAGQRLRPLPLLAVWRGGG